MLHFIGKIRRELLANSKAIRYLKYVVGEIILVVIGILIAIQADNWNEDRKIANNNKRLFLEVNNELVENVERIDRVIDPYLFTDTLYYKMLNKEIEYGNDGQVMGLTNVIDFETDADGNRKMWKK